MSGAVEMLNTITVTINGYNTYDGEYWRGSNGATHRPVSQTQGTEYKFRLDSVTGDNAFPNAEVIVTGYFVNGNTEILYKGNHDIPDRR